MVKIIKVLIVLLVTGLLVFLSACEKQSETKKQTTKPVIVSGVILPPQAVGNDKKTVPEVVTPVKNHQARVISKPKTKAIVQTQPGVVTETLLKREEEAIADSQAGKNGIQKKVSGYDPKGKINPFIPLIQAKEEKGAKSVVDDEKPKKLLTPLEKIELSQIKLVAVILMKDRQLAMVEESTGKGYEVKIGTYIGKNSGQVSKINQSSIIVKEYVKDYKGKRQAHFQEIKLHKKESGE